MAKKIEKNVQNDAAVPANPVINLTTGTKKRIGTVGVLPLSSIEVQKGHNPRSNPAPSAELIQSVTDNGVLQNLIVRPKKKGDGFYIVAGERRFLAANEAVKAGASIETVPVLIREDLRDDDAGALAVAIAENSEDVRNGLTPLDLGRSLQTLVEKFDWKPGKLSKETGVHEQTIRRVLKLVSAPKDVQKAVEDGTLGFVAGLELAKIDEPAVRSKVQAEIARLKSEENVENVTANQVREINKRVSKDEGGDGASGKLANKKKGKDRGASLRVWKNHNAVNKQLAAIASIVVGASEEERQTSDYFALQGALAFGLWERGDIDQPSVPGTEKADDETQAAFERRTKAFSRLVVALAKEDTSKPKSDAEAAEGAEDNAE